MATIIDLESRRAARQREQIDADEDGLFGALDFDLADTVTHADLAQVKSELKAEIRVMEARRLEAFEARVDADLDRLNRRLRRVEKLAGMRLWVFLAAGSATALFGLAFSLL